MPCNLLFICSRERGGRWGGGAIPTKMPFGFAGRIIELTTPKRPTFNSLVIKAIVRANQDRSEEVKCTRVFIDCLHHDNKDRGSNLTDVCCLRAC